MKLIFLFFISTAPVIAVIDGQALILNIWQEQVQQSKLNAKTSDGRRDRTTNRVRVLHVETRAMGSGNAENVTFRWFFIGRSPVDGSFDYYSHGTADKTIPRIQSLTFQIVSDPLRQEQYVEQEFSTSVKVTAGSLPQGWVVWVLQNGSVIKKTTSEPGLLDWMVRNPPPVLPRKKA